MKVLRATMIAAVCAFSAGATSGSVLDVERSGTDVGNGDVGNGDVGNGSGEDGAASGPIPEDVNPSDVPADEPTGC